DAQYSPGAIDGGDFQRAGFADAQAAGIHEGEAGPMDRVADGAEQAADLIVRQRARQPLLPRRADLFFPRTTPRPGRACGRRRTAAHTGQSGTCRAPRRAGAGRAGSDAPLPRRAGPASDGSTRPVARPPGRTPPVSPRPGRPGSSPRSSVCAVATWWSPSVDALASDTARRPKEYNHPA